MQKQTKQPPNIVALCLLYCCPIFRDFAGVSRGIRQTLRVLLPEARLLETCSPDTRLLEARDPFWKPFPGKSPNSSDENQTYVGDFLQVGHFYGNFMEKIA